MIKIITILCIIIILSSCVYAFNVIFDLITKVVKMIFKKCRSKFQNSINGAREMVRVLNEESNKNDEINNNEEVNDVND